MNPICKRTLQISGVLFIFFMAYVVFAADSGSLPLLILQIYAFPGGDKVGHFILLGILTFFANQLLFPRTMRASGWVFQMGSVIVFCGITVEEISQMVLPNRAFDPLDLVASYLGILIGDLVFRSMHGGDSD